MNRSLRSLLNFTATVATGASAGLLAASPAGALSAHQAACPNPAKVLTRPAGPAALKVTWRPANGAPKDRSYRIWRSGAVVGQTRKRFMNVPVVPGRRVTIAVGMVGARGETPLCRKQVTASAAPAERAKLGRVSGLAAAAVTDRSASLTWGKVRGAAGYRVTRDGKVLGQPRRTSLKVKLAAGRVYRFHVIAVDGHGRPARAGGRSLKLTVGHRAPATPGNVGVSAADDTSITLRWAAANAGSEPIRGYRLYRDGVVVGQTASTSMTVRNLPPARSFRVQVAAIDSRGYLSSLSAPVTAYTLRPQQAERTGTYAYLLASTDSSFESFKAHYRQIGTVIPTYFYCDKDVKSITGKDDPRITQFAKLRGVKVTPRFDCQGTTKAHKLLTDPQAKEIAISGLVELVKQHDYDGISMDVEAAPASDRDAMTAFVAELSDRLHRAGATLSMAASAKTADVRNHPRSTAFDYRALAQHADRIMVMGWGLHWSTSKAGPVSDMRWFSKVVSYVATIPNKDRFVLTVPLYLTDWAAGGGPLNPSSMYTWPQLGDLIGRSGAQPIRDPEAAEMHLAYTDESGVGHDVWYLDAKAVQDRLNMAAANGFGGVGVWRLGQEDPAVWQTTPFGGPGV